MKTIIFTFILYFIASSATFFNSLPEIHAQPSNNNVTTIGTELLYSSNNGNITNVRVIDIIEPMKIEISFIEKGTLYSKEPIEVTNQGTYVETFVSNNIVRGEGKGIITMNNGEFTAWEAYDSKLINSNGNGSQTYQGIIFFNSNSENLAFLDHKIGLYISKVGVDGESGNRQIWDWK